MLQLAQQFIVSILLLSKLRKMSRRAATGRLDTTALGPSSRDVFDRWIGAPWIHTTIV